MVIDIHLCWQSNKNSSILLLAYVRDEFFFHRHNDLLSLWIAPRVPPPRSGLHCAPESCLLGAESYALGHSMF